MDNTSSKIIKSTIGLLTADEIVFAGTAGFAGSGTAATDWFNEKENYYYLMDNVENYFYRTMSYQSINYFEGYDKPDWGYDEYIFVVGSNGKLYSVYGQATPIYTIRPTIVLKSDVEFEEIGNGLQTSPYIIK